MGIQLQFTFLASQFYSVLQSGYNGLVLENETFSAKVK